MDIGIIGFGQFGQFFGKHLKEKHIVFAADIIGMTKEAYETNIRFASIREAASKDAVILAVPISAFENVLKEIKDMLNPGAVVMDVCSAKAIPCRLMKKILPKNAEIIGTHPLFGPQSGRNGIKGLKIVVCSIRAKKESVNRAKEIFHDLGLEIIEATPEEHDKAMAVSHALMHLIAKGLINTGVKNQGVKIPALEKAVELIDIFKDDSPQLFRDVQNFNPFAKRVRKRFIKELLDIDSKLE